MRFDLTVPLARFAARMLMRWGLFQSYHIAPVYAVRIRRLGDTGSLSSVISIPLGPNHAGRH